MPRNKYVTSWFNGCEEIDKGSSCNLHLIGRLCNKMWWSNSHLTWQNNIRKLAYSCKTELIRIPHATYVIYIYIYKVYICTLQLETTTFASLIYVRWLHKWIFLRNTSMEFNHTIESIAEYRYYFEKKVFKSIHVPFCLNIVW